MSEAESSVTVGHGRGQLLPSLAVALSGALWGLFWIPLRLFDERGVNPAWVSLLFFAVTIAAVLPFAARAVPRLATRDARLLVTGLMTGAAFTLYTVSLIHTEVVRALLLFYLTPVWSTFLGFMVMGHPITRNRLAALALGIAGLLVVLDYRSGVPLPRNVGDWMALASGVMWAAGTIRLYAEGTVRITDTVFTFAVGGFACSLLIMAVPQLGLGEVPATAAVESVLPAVVGVAFVAFVPTNFLILWGSQRVNPGRVGILLMTECVVGTASAALFSGEPFGWREAVGTLLILGAGVVELVRRTTRA